MAGTWLPTFYSGFTHGVINSDANQYLLNKAFGRSYIPIDVSSEYALCIEDDQGLTQEVMDAAFTAYLARDYAEFGRYVSKSYAAWELSLMNCEGYISYDVLQPMIEDLFDYLANEPSLLAGADPDETMINNINNDGEIDSLFR